MAKTPKKAWHKSGQNQAPQQKDDGTRWRIVRDGRAVYPSGAGTTRAEAERLVAGLLGPAEIVEVAAAQ